MIYLEAFQVAILIMLFINTSYSDIKYGLVKNQSIFITLICGLISSILYYVFFATDCFTAYAINVLIGICISFILYAMGIWGAGDTKLLSVTIIIFPARLYCMGNRSMAACFVLIALIFIIAFIYIIVETFVIGIKNRDLLKIQHISFSWQRYAKGFLFIFLFINIFDFILFKILPENLLIDKILLTAINFIAILIATRLEEKTNWGTVLVMSTLWVILLFFGIVKFGIYKINWIAYLMALFLALLRVIADKYNYKSIPVDTLKPGMILSMGSIFMFSQSRVKGLPSFSSENLKSRLTIEEVDSIVRWSKTKNGQDTIIIVRKIPFALFIGIGTLFFALLEVISR